VRPLPAAALDVLAVCTFVVAGRRTHAEGLDAAATAATAWPFLAGLAGGWTLVRAWRDPAALRTGVLVWAATVVGGLVLRRVSGGGTPLTFVAVAATSLAVLLLGWRLVARRTSVARQTSGLAAGNRTYGG
jgi:hypothetical protein